MVYESNLAPVIAPPLIGRSRAKVLQGRSTSTVRAICARASVRCRVFGGPSIVVIYRRAGGHGYTFDDEGVRHYVIDRSLLPQRDPERAVRELELLAYVFHDYAARETVCGRGIFVYPVGPEHGRAWLAAIGRLGGHSRSVRKGVASRANGAKSQPPRNGKTAMRVVKPGTYER